MADEGNFTEDRKSTDPIIMKSCPTDFPLLMAGPKLCYKMTNDGDVLVNCNNIGCSTNVGSDTHLSRKRTGMMSMAYLHHHTLDNDQRLKRGGIKDLRIISG